MGDLKESAWYRNNQLLFERPSTGFILNDVLALHQEIGFVSQAWTYNLWDLAKKHPEMSNAQLCAMYLCRYKHSLTKDGKEQWSRTEKDQLAAAEEVAREENYRLECFLGKHPRMEGEVSRVRSERLSPKCRVEDLKTGMDLVNHLEEALQVSFDPATELEKMASLRDKALRAERELYEAKIELEQAERAQRERAKKMAKQQRKEERALLEAATQRAALEAAAQREKEHREKELERGRKLEKELEKERQLLQERQLQERQERERQEQERQEQERERQEQEQERQREISQQKKKEQKKAAKKPKQDDEDDEEAALEAAILEVAKQEKKAADAERLKMEEKQRVERADEALAALTLRPKIYMPKHDVPPVPTRMAIYTFLLCCSMREKLMLNILATFSVWASSLGPLFPPYNDMRTIFTSHENTGLVVPPLKPYFKNSSVATVGFVRVVQSLRNIVGVVFDLTHVLFSSNIFVFNSRFQVLYSLCNSRQFSMLVLEGIEGLTESGSSPCPLLLEIYRRVSAFEQFIQGPDFSLLCMCLPRPTLPDTPAPHIPLFPKSCPRDIISHLFLMGPLEIVLHDLPAEWQNYKNLCSPILYATKKLWQENEKYLRNWSMGKDVPELDLIYDEPGSLEKAGEWFGSLDVFHSARKHLHGNAMETTWEFIVGAGASFGHDTEQECILALILSPSILEIFAKEHVCEPIYAFRFPLTIQEVRYFFSLKHSPLLL
jgi:hypothetical protein